MDREFPELLKQLHSIEIDYNDGEGIDFEPFDSFYSKSETTEWIKAWTGNNEVDGNDYLIFGQDGSGGYAAFWCVKDNCDLLQQPIVFFGSEGELGIIAQTFYDYLWLFARGVGPYEATVYPDESGTENQLFLDFAVKYANSHESSASNVIKRAASEFPEFISKIESLC
ncbi:MAG: hypothetical protein ACJAVU_003510 [Cognaticolwellia sp.]|jgi:hypothetical protein